MKTYIKLLAFIFISGFLSAQSGQVKGKVFDAGNNEPLPFANVMIEGTQTGAVTDLDGNFIITGLKPGYFRLVVSYLGYKQQTSEDILISNNNNPFIDIALEPNEKVLNEVLITVDPFSKKVESPISMQSIGAKEIESNPGSNRDISRVIQSFPGVGSTPNFRNDVIIRGGGPSENRFYLDDVEIPVLNHFSTQGASGGPVGIINADFIKSVDFYSGSFPANKYNALSGILDFKQKDGSKDRTNIQLALGASEASLTLDGPAGSKSNYIFSVRRSYLQYLFSAIGLPFLPTFNDYQLRFKTDFDKKNQLTIISIGSLDKNTLNTGIENPDLTQEFILSQIPVNNQWSYTFGAVYKHFFNTGNHTLVMSRNMLDNSFYKYPDNDESKPRLFDYYSTEAENKIRYELNFRKNEVKYVISAGTEYAKYYNDTKQDVFRNGEVINFKYRTDLDMIKYSVSGQLSKRILRNRLLTSVGFRLDGNNYNSSMQNLFNQFSPRISFSYTLTDKSALNAGAGRYFQLPAYTTLGFRNLNSELVNKDAKYIGVNQYSLGIEYRLTKSIILSTEAFYKDYFQYPIDIESGISLANQGADFNIAGASEIISKGVGRATGFEVLGRANFKSFSSIASYTFVRSLFNDINNKEIPSSWDSRHLFTITGSKEFNKNWRAGFKWRYVGGLPYTPYDLEKSKNIAAWNASGRAYNDFTKLNSERLKPFHQLDIRVDKNFFFRSWSLMIYVDIQNLYNLKYTGQEYIIRQKDENGSYMTTDNGKNYILQAVENESGNVLPTIGIMIKL
ncbi:MAG: TonB-dependent receptor [Saprospiraceae bacterium]|nr:TonB-dependent receptor [Saprospiraceae bacterium]